VLIGDQRFENVLHEIDRHGMSTMQHKVQRLRAALKLPKEFTLRRHDGA
jgi:hypothetical protein